MWYLCFFLVELSWNCLEMWAYSFRRLEMEREHVVIGALGGEEVTPRKQSIHREEKEQGVQKSLGNISS